MIENNKLAEGVFNLLPINKVYDDLFSPGMKKAGEALSTVLDLANLAMFPFRLINERSRIYLKHNLTQYSEKLNNAQSLKLTQVPQYVGIPILEKLTMLDKNELSEAFVNLLTKASFEETMHQVHPSFLSILEKLSVDEAKILWNYKDTLSIPIMEVHLVSESRLYPKQPWMDLQGPKSREELHLLNNYLHQKRHTMRYAWNLTRIDKEIELSYPQNIDLYIENLLKNGIFEISNMGFIEETKASDVFEKMENLDYKDLIERIRKIGVEGDLNYTYRIELIKQFMEQGQIGKNFISACVKDIDLEKIEQSKVKPTV